MPNESLSTWDIALLFILARVRGVRPATAFNYSKLKTAGSVEAIRKRMERLCDKGFLAKSPLPRGGQIFRLSHKGVRFTSAPSAFANAPSLSIAAEMISASAVGWQAGYLFLTAVERDSLLTACAKDSDAKLAGRMLLRAKTDLLSTGDANENHLHYWLAEPRPADELAQRVEIIAQNVSRFSIINDLKTAGLFAISIAVPSEGVKASLGRRKFPVSAEVVVVTELQDLFA